MGRTTREERDAELRAYVARLAERAKPEAWNAYVRDLEVPRDIGAAMMTGRAELVAGMPARAMGEDEVRVLLGVVAGLMETNAALREHAAQVSSMVGQWMDALKGMQSVARQIEDFAAFRHDAAAAGDDEE